MVTAHLLVLPTAWITLACTLGFSHRLFGRDSPQIQIEDANPEAPPILSQNPASHVSELIANGQWTDAAKLAQDLAQRRPYDTSALYYLGLTQLHFNDPIASVRTLRAAQRLGMDSASFHQALGISYYNIHQFVLFEQEMEKAKNLAPSDYKPYYYVGRYLESARNDFARALEQFTKARSLNPQHAESWYYEGYCLEATGKSDEARAAYDSALRRLEHSHAAFSLPDQGIARLLLDSQPTLALDFARKAIALEPRLESNRLVIAKIYERLGRVADARRELETAERLDPSDATPRFLLSRLYSQIGDRQAAESELAMFKELKHLYGQQ